MLRRILRRSGALIDRFPAVAYVAVGVAATTLFLWVQASGNFPDPDSFYHARMAALVAERGPVHDFPWLAQTVFADSYVDHHFLYHVLLIPFLPLAPDLAGAIRLSSLVFAVAAVLAGTMLLRRLGAGKVAFLAPFLFLLSNPLVFRLNLAKTPALALVTLFAGFYAAARAKPLLLGFIAFAYVWLYDGWIVLPVAVAALILADALVPERAGTHTAERGWHWRDRLLGRRSGALMGATLAGIALGHVVNPYFPENLAWEWLHIVRIGIVGFKETIAVGAEWYPYAPLELFAVTATTFHALLLGAAAFFVALMRSRETGKDLPRDRVRDTVAFFLFAALAWLFAVRSKRNVEYFVPFAVFASVSSLDLFFGAGGWEAMRRSVRSLFGRAAVGAWVLGAYLALVLALVAVRDLSGVRRDFRNGAPPTKYAGLAAWLDANVPEGARIFHNDWDDFPYFFLQTTRQRWLVGLDPTFMYVKDPVRFREWVDITQGRITDRLAERIREDFGAAYAFVDSDHAALKAALEQEPGVQPLYGDAEGTIYAVAPR